jgi:hypothetical protein
VGVRGREGVDPREPFGRRPVWSKQPLPHRHKLPEGHHVVSIPICSVNSSHGPLGIARPYTNLAFEGYQHAGEHGKGNDYNHRVWKACFVQDQDIGRIDMLTRLAGDIVDPENWTTD